MRGPLQPHKSSRCCRAVRGTVEKGQGLFRRINAPLGQQLRHERMPADSSTQRRRRFDLG